MLILVFELRHETCHLILQDLELNDGRALETILHILYIAWIREGYVLTVTHLDIEIDRGSTISNATFLCDSCNQSAVFDGVHWRSIFGAVKEEKERYIGEVSDFNKSNPPTTSLHLMTNLQHGFPSLDGSCHGKHTTRLLGWSRSR
jgi:hypothetical protein